MTRRQLIELVCSLSIVFLASIASGQVINFETLPDGTPTSDGQEISDQYEAAFGVSFALLDHTTGLPAGNPHIAKVGPPLTAFGSLCFGEDTPIPGQGLGSSFLTDDGLDPGPILDLLVTYSSPVAQASGVLIDTDCRIDAGPPCEQWTITAYDAGAQPVGQVVIDGPQEQNPYCSEPAGLGDALAQGWFFNEATPIISSVRIRHTGTVTAVGIAFDNFSPTCACEADLNGDGLRDGLDVQGFVDCVTGSGDPNCGCADVDGVVGLDYGDVAAFVDKLLLGEPCS